MAAKKMLTARNGKVRSGSGSEPKRLSKAGEWLMANPRGLGVTIYDMKALMR